ncbi:MAG: hypothetical protein MI867_08155 [Pseudomonadales bacterium]|nr:hypothetical protein [Pseudomonadales bacterium]
METIKILIERLKYVLQLSIAVGLFILFFYVLRVGHYPTGITIGDGLLFVAIALCFGFLYSIISGLLFCIVITLTPFIRAIQRAYFYIKRRTYHGEEKFDELPEIPKITLDEANYSVIGFFGLIFLAILAFNDLSLFIGLAFSVFLMAVIYWFRWVSSRNNNGNEDSTKVWILHLAIYFVPLFVGKFQGGLIDSTMSTTGVRNEKAHVLFLGDYKSFVKSTIGDSPNDIYKAKVLFQGVGSNSVIEIEGKRFVVPNSMYYMYYQDANKLLKPTPGGSA